MMISYIQAAQSEGHNFFRGRIPSILQLQDMIEHAWDMGFNLTGRVETGGIRGTRKYIGTPEVMIRLLWCKGRADKPRPKHFSKALVLGMYAMIFQWERAHVTPRCTADSFSEPGDLCNEIGRLTVHQELFRAVERYFSQSSSNTSPKVCRTSLPPIYFQHRGKQTN